MQFNLIIFYFNYFLHLVILYTSYIMFIENLSIVNKGVQQTGPSKPIRKNEAHDLARTELIGSFTNQQAVSGFTFS